MKTHVSLLSVFAILTLPCLATGLGWKHIRSLPFKRPSEPFDIAVGPKDGLLYIADALKNRIGEFEGGEMSRKLIHGCFFGVFVDMCGHHGVQMRNPKSKSETYVNGCKIRPNL